MVAAKKKQTLQQQQKASSMIDKHVLVGGPLLGAAAPDTTTTFAPLITAEISSSSTSSERFILLPNRHFITVLAFQTGERLGTLVLESESGKASENIGIDCVVLANHGRRRPVSSSQSASSLSVADLFQAAASSSSSDKNKKDTSNNDNEAHRDDDDGHVVLVACSNGTIQEFVLSDLLLGSNSSSSSTSLGHAGPHLAVPGPCYSPRRILQLSLDCSVQQTDDDDKKPTIDRIRHLTIPNKQHQQLQHQQERQGLVGYALVDTTIPKMDDNNGNKHLQQQQQQLVRFTLPPPLPPVAAENASTNGAHGSTSKRNHNKKKKKTATTAAAAHTELITVDSMDTFDPISSTEKSTKTPLALLSVVVHHSGGGIQRNSKKSDVLVIVARPSCLTVYLDNRHNDHAGTLYPSAIYNDWPATTNPLDTVELSPDNGNNSKTGDVAIGLARGEIRVLDGFLPQYADYLVALDSLKSEDSNSSMIQQLPPPHPSKAVIWRKLHWHANGVSSLSYERFLEDDDDEETGNGSSNNNNSGDISRVLYSGGTECVLVAWQMAGGSYRPADTLPRIALGGIVHLVTSSMSTGNAGILVYCSDNTLVLYEAHNFKLVWKVQGLTAGVAAGDSSGSGAPPSTDGQHVEGKLRLKMTPDLHGNKNVVVSGLQQAPGTIQWLDPARQRVVKTLEVVAYNRVSRAEKEDIPIPAPSVTRTAWSAEGKDLMTIHMTPTSNSCMGVNEKMYNGRLQVGLVTVLRFWTSSASSSSYEPCAAMSYPHGRQNKVSAIALSHNGSVACTVSNDDKAFRLWRKTRTVDTVQVDGKDAPVRVSSYAWTCAYKVGIPAGFSNFSTGNHAVAFSSDDSILAIAFGSMITLWNHQQANLIATLRHLDAADKSDVVESLQFLPASGRFPDSLISRSSQGITLQSPYGALGPTNLGWHWKIPSTDKNIAVTTAEYVPAHDNQGDAVAVSLYDKSNDCSHILWISVETGQARFDKTNCQIRGIIVSITASLSSSNTPAALHTSMWTAEGVKSKVQQQSSSSSSSSMNVHVLMDDGQVLALKSFYQEPEDTGVTTTTTTPNQFAAGKQSSFAATDASQEEEGGGGGGGGAPIIDLLANSLALTKKRGRDEDSSSAAVANATIVNIESGSPLTKKLALDNFGGTTSNHTMDDVGGGDEQETLPLLNGAFTRAFVGRNLSRRER